MRNLSAALFELRVHALLRIAQRKGIKTKETTIRALASRMSDAQVLAELARIHPALRWIWNWIARRA
jgi:hypothetical protein